MDCAFVEGIQPSTKAGGKRPTSVKADNGAATVPWAAARCEAASSSTPAGNQPTRCILASAGATCNRPAS
jgi:hypothetical protein